MKTCKMILTAVIGAVLLSAGAPVWGAKGGIPGKPPPSEEPPPEPMDYPFYFWKLGHMDGPHNSSKALGISRDGKVAVGSTVVVDFDRAWRMDVDWMLSTEDDGIPPLYNELQVQEDIGVVAPSRYSAAYAASDMTCSSYTYDISDKENRILDWCGSFPVGTLDIGQVSYGIEWLLPPLAADEGYEFVNGIDYWTIPDFGGGIADMVVYDLSADGLILVGTGNTATGPVAFRADTTVVDEEGVPIPVQLTITDMFYTEQTLHDSSAQAVSADGLIIAGYGGTKRGNKAFVTTFLGMDEATGEALLESYVLPAIDGGQWSEAYAMTPDGLYIAGRSDSPKGPQACIWFWGVDPETQTEGWVVKALGGLSKKKLDSIATGIVQRPGAVDGELMVVGYSQSILYPSEAFVWAGNPVLEPDGADGEFIGYLYDLEYILTKTGAGEASLMGSSWILNQATGVALNDDFTARIVGWGVNPEGGIEAWLVDGFPYEELEPLFVKE